MKWPHSLGDWIWQIVFIGGAVALGLVEEALRRRKQRRSKSWPISYGQITSTQVEPHRYEFWLRLYYSYTVPSEPYPVPADFIVEFRTADEADHWAKALPGQTIPVRYNPKNPWKSQLWESELKTIVQASSVSTEEPIEGTVFSNK